MKQSMTAMVLALFALGSASVFAQPGQEAGQEAEQRQQQQQQAMPQMDIQGKEFSQLDGNQDGMISESEAQEAGVEPVAFDALDADDDELVSEDEFEHAKEEGGGAR
jgi:type II secretory pathway component PulM